MLCSPAASAAPSASASGADSRPSGPGGWRRRSTTVTSGSGRGVARSGSTRRAKRPRVDVVGALERRRRRAEDRDRARALRAHDRQIAPVVADALLLLERRVVLLVDDDDAQRAHRREHGRARAQRDADLARPQAPPGRQPLARRQRAVQHRDVVAEAGPEARRQLRRQRDLGHQHQRAPPRRARRRDDAQVDLGLARAGDPLKQEAGEAARQRGDQRVDGVRLRRHQRDPCAARAAARASGARATAPVLDARQPGRDQRAQRRPLGRRQRRHDAARRPPPPACPPARRLAAARFGSASDGRARSRARTPPSAADAGSAPRRPPRPAPPSTSRGSRSRAPAARRARSRRSGSSPPAAASAASTGSARDASGISAGWRSSACRPAAVRRTARVALACSPCGSAARSTSPSGAW